MVSDQYLSLCFRKLLHMGPEQGSDDNQKLLHMGREQGSDDNQMFLLNLVLLL